MLQLHFPDEGKVRNYPRELAGAFTESAVPGVYRILHDNIKKVWGLELPDRVEAEAMDAIIGEMLDGLLKRVLAYFPPEITSNTLELSELFNKYSRIHALAEEERLRNVQSTGSPEVPGGSEGPHAQPVGSTGDSAEVEGHRRYPAGDVGSHEEDGPQV